MNRRALAGWMVILAVALTGCATGGGGTGSMSINVGQAYGNLAFNTAVDVLRDREGYPVDQQRGAPNLLVRTVWHSRTPFEDEQAEGVTEAQTRFTMQGRPRTRNPDGDHLYNVSLRAENRVRFQGESEWTPLRTEDFESYAEYVAGEMSAELDMRVRD